MRTKAVILGLVGALVIVLGLGGVRVHNLSQQVDACQKVLAVTYNIEADLYAAVSPVLTSQGSTASLMDLAQAVIDNSNVVGSNEYQTWYAKCVPSATGLSHNKPQLNT